MKIKNMFIAIFTLINLMIKNEKTNKIIAIIITIINLSLINVALYAILTMPVSNIFKIFLFSVYTLVVGVLLYKITKKEKQKTFLKMYVLLFLFLLISIIITTSINLTFLLFFISPMFIMLEGVIILILSIKLMLKTKDVKIIKLILGSNIFFMNMILLFVIVVYFLSHKATFG